METRCFATSFNLLRRHGLLAMLALGLAGCFNEPTPAYKTVQEGQRVYGELPTKVEICDYVNLDRKGLTEFPEVLLKCPNLKWLRLNDNQLSAIPDLSGLKNLRRIYLKNNSLNEVPEGLKGLEGLTDIELSGNPISQIPQWLAEKKGLKNLSFNRTMISKLPDDLSAWKSLQSLQLGELNLSAEEMARIRKALPEVAIIW